MTGMDADQVEETPPCPGCGGRTATALTQTLEFHAQDYEKTGKPISVLVVYKCPCGTAYTHRVEFSPPSRDELPGE
jgi:hypothetical protein